MYRKIITRISIALLVFSTNAKAQSQLSNSVQFEIETFAESFLSQTKVPGLSMAVSKEGDIIYSKGFGYANIEENIKMDPTIRLRTASVAKLITATALAKLASEGKLDFDAPIKNYVPYINKTYADLTSRQLAGHTAGLAHRPKGERYKKKQYDTMQETVELMDAPLLFEPDTDYKYSTHAYNLLGAVIEGASGQSYFDYMNEAIFKPLGMTDTFVENIENLTKKDAQIYYVHKNKRRKEGLTNASYKVPGAGFRSTPTDLVKMMDAYTNGFISKEIVSDMFASHQLKNGKKTNVGITWRSSIDPFNNIVIEHAGSWRGARTVVVHFPEENLNISLMVNAQCPVVIEETAHLFAQIIRNSNPLTSEISITNEDVTVTFNSEKGKEEFKGTFTIDGNRGLLSSDHDGFLKENPLIYLGSENHYALSTAHGLLYVQLKNNEMLEGKLFLYSNRLSNNPTSETPMMTFKTK